LFDIYNIVPTQLPPVKSMWYNCSMSHPTPSLPQYLQQQLDERDWSLRTLAKHAQVAPSTISLTLRGHTVPGPDTLRRVAAALEVDETHLLRLAGHLDAPNALGRDPAVEFLAQQLDDLPPTVRTSALAAFGAMLNTILDLMGWSEGDEQVREGEKGEGEVEKGS
jgi:transcriptional regulator with XRE-family HTH domain